MPAFASHYTYCPTTAIEEGAHIVPQSYDYSRGIAISCRDAVADWIIRVTMRRR